VSASRNRLYDTNTNCSEIKPVSEYKDVSPNTIVSGTLQAVSNSIGTVQSQGVKSFSSMPMSPYPNKGSAFSSHPNSVNVLQAPVVWIISDVQGLRQHVFLELGAKVINVWFDLHSKGQLESLQNSLESQRPELVWVRLHGPCIGSGNRRDNASAKFVTHHFPAK